MNPEPTVFVVDDDEVLRDALAQLLESAGMRVEAYPDGAAFLAACPEDPPGCLLLDIAMPGLSGLEVQEALQGRGVRLPILFLTGHGDIPMAVRAVQAGAVDFLEKPVPGAVLVERVRRALEVDRVHPKERHTGEPQTDPVQGRCARLSTREREVMAQVMAGLSSKEIAQRLGISYRTVEAHRSRLMEKMGAGNLVELVQLAGRCQG